MLIELLLPSPSEPVAAAVGKSNVNTPVAGPVSVRVTVSTSPLVPLVTVAVTVPLPTRSGSVICKVASSPAFAIEMLTTAVLPPLIVSLLVTVFVAPLACRSSI